jgi:hypothetical protein
LEFFNSAKFSKQSFYDYIRILKPAFIRYLKNISLLIATVALTVTIMMLALPEQNPDVKKPASSGGASYDKKTQEEQAKKNSILRRFISYNGNQTSF